MHEIGDVCDLYDRNPKSLQKEETGCEKVNQFR
jgi:hypothetical protein